MANNLVFYHLLRTSERPLSRVLHIPTNITLQSAGLHDVIHCLLCESVVLMTTVNTTSICDAVTANWGRCDHETHLRKNKRVACSLGSVYFLIMKYKRLCEMMIIKPLAFAHAFEFRFPPATLQVLYFADSHFVIVAASVKGACYILTSS